jgi:eukaryotic-like serine/threonine-protein kinase
MSPVPTMSDGAERWRRLEEVCQAALERPAEERAAFLAQACGADEELRREAASLLEREARVQGFLETPLGELAADATYSPGEPRDFIGRRVGAYEIRARLGAGGMGEVYRAHDHTLGRDVAIKVLPAAFSADRERLARFEREARLLASLSHPHIGAIYGLEGSGDVRALVLELIDGETLETRLGRGPLAAAHALTLAVQIAEALDHAHRQGVTHRDLKPANVMLTKAGAKLLDFGLAKWGRGPSGYVNLSAPRMKPNGVDSLTEEGMILGTPHYMAPEQLEGKEADARADVFAFGAVLYEMLTGRKAFDGGSAAAVMAAVLNAEPAPLAAIQPLVPRSLERLIQKCLAKDRDQRWQTARDLADELKWIADEAASPVIPSLDHARDAAAGTTAARRLRRVQFSALLMIAGAFVGFAGWRLARSRESSAPAVLTRFAVQPPAATVIDAFDISPDGTALTYVGRSRTAIRLFLRRLDQFGDSPISGTDGASSPLFSPDGRWVAFFSGRRLLKVNVQTTAAPILLSENIDRWLNGATWLADGTIIFSRPNHGLQRVSAEGGDPLAVTSLSPTPPDVDHHSPTLLPGGKALLFTVHAHDGRFNVVVETLATAERKLLIESAYDARYVTSGHLVFARNRAILAVPFDLQRLEVTGPPVTLVEPVAGKPIDGNGGYRLSTNGTLAFLPEPSLDGRTLMWVERTGAETPLPIPARAFSSPRVSPDGSRLAFAVAEAGRHDIYTYELASGTLGRLTRAGDNRAPIWTRDGQRVTYSSSSFSSSSTSTPSTRDDARQLVWQSVDSSRAPERLVSGGISLVPGTWSADGHVLVYTDGGTGPAGTGIFALPWDGDRKPQQLVDGPGEELEPSFSPDGRWLAFTSTETSRYEVYVAAFPDTRSRHQITVEGGRAPKWSRDGRELVYRYGGRMFAVPVDTTRGVSTGKPRMLFDAGGYVLGAARGSDVLGVDDDLAPDGRFMMVKPGPEEQAPPGLHVVLNWVDELKRRVPKGQ